MQLGIKSIRPVITGDVVRVISTNSFVKYIIIEMVISI